MGTVKRRLILFFMQSWFYSWLMKHILWRIRLDLYYPEQPGNMFKEAHQILVRGDILLSTDSAKLTCKCIPGILDHAALCIGKNPSPDIKEVAEMVHDGYREVHFNQFCAESTRIIIMRCVNWDEVYISRVIEKCRSFDGTPYDIGFELGIAALYCSEIVYQSDEDKTLDVSLEDLAGIGRPYISPMGLLFSPVCICVYDSAKEFTGLMGHEIAKLIK